MTYIEFINNILDTRGRFNCGNEYHERHHILPKCMGGTDVENNLIDLYAREHFIAHKLLADEHPDEEKLIYALWCMSNIKNEHTFNRYELTPEEYEEAKIVFVKLQSKRQSGENNYFHKVHFCGEKNGFYGDHRFAGANHPRCRPVYCPELDEVFWGAKEAQDKYGIWKADIAKCCKGELKHAGKHPIAGVPLTWFYADATEEERERLNLMHDKPHQNSKKVYSSELDMHFDSATEAAKFVNTSIGNICSCCNGDPRHKHAGRHPETGELLTWIYV